MNLESEIEGLALGSLNKVGTSIEGTYISVKSNSALCFESTKLFNQLELVEDVQQFNNNPSCHCTSAPTSGDWATNTACCGGYELTCAGTCDFGLCTL